LGKGKRRSRREKRLLDTYRDPERSLLLYLQALEWGETIILPDKFGGSRDKDEA
jgi:hypothetical protein